MVAVTAVSSNHFHESHDYIGSLQISMPNKTIYVYDLGLQEHEVTYFRNACNVQVRKFEFQKYPDHVKNLDEYAWKPLLLQEVLEEFEVVLWVMPAPEFSTQTGFQFWMPSCIFPYWVRGRDFHGPKISIPFHTILFSILILPYRSVPFNFMKIPFFTVPYRFIKFQHQIPFYHPIPSITVQYRSIFHTVLLF